MRAARSPLRTLLLLLLPICAVLLSLMGAVDANTRYEEDEVTGYVAATREEILSTRKLRRKQFGEILARYEAELGGHESGEELLTEQRHRKVLQKIKAYKHKLEELDLDHDPRFVDRLLAREAHLNEVTRARILRRSTGADEF